MKGKDLTIQKLQLQLAMKDKLLVQQTTCSFAMASRIKLLGTRACCS